MQKTAYEVLISDWSSDVCSSDLTPMGAVLFHERIIGAFAATGKTVPFGHTFSANTLCAATCLAVVNYMGDQKILENVLARGKQLETAIGSASCGERVGESVLIWWVDVSLIKIEKKAIDVI